LGWWRGDHAGIPAAEEGRKVPSVCSRLAPALLSGKLQGRVWAWAAGARCGRFRSMEKL